jgi:hypothetical protein
MAISPTFTKPPLRFEGQHEKTSGWIAEILVNDFRNWRECTHLDVGGAQVVALVYFKRVLASTHRSRVVWLGTLLFTLRTLHSALYTPRVCCYSCCACRTSTDRVIKNKRFYLRAGYRFAYLRVTHHFSIRSILTFLFAGSILFLILYHTILLYYCVFCWYYNIMILRILSCCVILYYMI